MPDSNGNYINFSDLPSSEVEEGAVAFTNSPLGSWEYANLSAITSNSFRFGGNGSFLQTTGKTSSFTDSANPFTIEFWSYIEDSARTYPVFTIQDVITSNTISCLAGNSLTSVNNIVHAPVSNFSQLYQTSEFFPLGGNIRADSSLLSFTSPFDPFTIDFHTRVQLSASTTDCTIFNISGDDPDPTLLSLNRFNIETNGKTILIPSDHKFKQHEWQYNLLSYDGFDYTLFRNDSSHVLNYGDSTNGVFDSNKSFTMTTMDTLSDIALQTKVTFPSSNSTLLKLGDTTNNITLETINTGTTLKLSVGDTSMNLNVSGSVPNDGANHVVSADVRVNPGRIRLYMDNNILGTASYSGGNLVNGSWAGTDVASDNVSYTVNPATFFTPNSRASGRVPASIAAVDGGRSYRVSPHGNFVHNSWRNQQQYFDKSFTINQNDTGLRYFEIKVVNQFNKYHTWYYHVVRFLWRSLSTLNQRYFYIGTTDAHVYPYHPYGLKLNNDETIAVHINQTTKTIFYHRASDGAFLRTQTYGTDRVPNGPVLCFGIDWQYDRTRFIIRRNPQDWEYSPFSKAILTGPRKDQIFSSGVFGEYGGDNSGGSWAGTLKSDLRSYPQLFTPLSSKTFNIGTKDGSTSRYRGYMNQFRLRNQHTSSYSTPTSPVSSNSSTKLLINSTDDGQSVLSYYTDGKIVKNDEKIQVRPPQTKAWEHIALSYDGTNLKVYDDGVRTYNQPLNFNGASLSLGELDIGRAQYWSLDESRYRDSFYAQNYVKDFHILDSAKFSEDSFFVTTVDATADSSTVLLTAGTATVPNSGGITNVASTVNSSEFSPMTAADNGWIQTQAFSNNVSAIITTNLGNHQGRADLPKSIQAFELDSNFVAVTAKLVLTETDNNNNIITWTSIEKQSKPYVTVKQDNNKFLIEPVNTADSEARHMSLIVTGHLSDSSIPVFAQNLDQPLNKVELTYDYNDIGFKLAQAESKFIMNAGVITIADSAGVANEFSGITAKPFLTNAEFTKKIFGKTTLTSNIIDSDGALP